MVKIKVRGNKFNCPNQWKEITDLSKLVECSTLQKEIEFMTGASLDGISEAQLLPLITITSFVEEFYLPEIKCTDVNECSYFKMEEAKKVLTMEGRGYKKLYHLSKIYHPERTETIQILSSGLNLLNQINLFLSAYEEMFSYEPEQEEINAGIEELTGFSALATLYNLAGKDLLKIDQVGNSPAVIVYSVLMYEFKQGQYLKRLHEIRNKE